ncbi:hypothetical protein J2X36_004615 [Methylobacterium sp. BE186]|nr:hypothetical protein [Methylobacterium sp. BE186]
MPFHTSTLGLWRTVETVDRHHHHHTPYGVWGVVVEIVVASRTVDRGACGLTVITDEEAQA